MPGMAGDVSTVVTTILHLAMLNGAESVKNERRSAMDFFFYTFFFRITPSGRGELLFSLSHSVRTWRLNSYFF